MGDSTKQIEVTEYKYRWVIMIMASLVLACIQFGVFISAGAAGSLMGPEYGLSSMQFAMVSTMPYLMGFLGGIICGTIADRTSIRKVMIIALIIAIVGSAIRVVNITFASMLISCLLLGVSLAALNANSAKLLKVWFPKKGLGVAMGVYTTGASVGAAAALKLGVLLTVPQSFTLALVLVAIALVVWIFLGKTNEYEAIAHEPVIEHLGDVIKNKYVWIVSLFMFFLFGCSVTEQTFINSAFTDLTGDPNIASTIAMTNSICVALGGIVMPIFVGKLKRLKPVMIVCAVLMCINMITVLVLPYSWFTWARMVLQGIYMGTLLPLGKSLPALIPNIKEEHLGAAGGIQSMFQNLGAWLIPAYILAPIITSTTGVSNLAYYVGAGICVLLSGICVLFIPETGTTVEEKNRRQAQLAEN